MLNTHYYASLVVPLALSRHFGNLLKIYLVWVLTYRSLFIAVRAQSENLGSMLVTITKKMIVWEIPSFCRASHIGL